MNNKEDDNLPKKFGRFWQKTIGRFWQKKNGKPNDKAKDDVEIKGSKDFPVEPKITQPDMHAVTSGESIDKAKDDVEIKGSKDFPVEPKSTKPDIHADTSGKSIDKAKDDVEIKDSKDFPVEPKITQPDMHADTSGESIDTKMETSKTRIYEIAKELNMKSKDIVSFLKNINGFNSITHLSYVDKSTYNRITKHFTSKSSINIETKYDNSDEIFDLLIKEVHYCNDLFHLGRELEEPFSELSKYWMKRKEDVQRKIIEQFPKDVDIVKDKEKENDDNFRYVLVRKSDGRNCCHINYNIFEELKGI